MTRVFETPIILCWIFVSSLLPTCGSSVYRHQPKKRYSSRYILAEGCNVPQCILIVEWTRVMTSTMMSTRHSVRVRLICDFKKTKWKSDHSQGNYYALVEHLEILHAVNDKKIIKSDWKIELQLRYFKFLNW